MSIKGICRKKLLYRSMPQKKRVMLTTKVCSTRTAVTGRAVVYSKEMMVIATAAGRRH